MASELIRKHGKTIWLGMAIELAYQAIPPEEGRRSPTRAEIKKAFSIVSADIDLEKFSQPETLRWYYLGRQNPKPLVEELLRKVDDLSRYTKDEHFQASMQVVQFIVRDLLLYFCQVPKWSGRPKGERPKVTPSKIAEIRSWLATRNKSSRCSVTALAKKLGLSRQTVYAVMKEIKK